MSVSDKTGLVDFARRLVAGGGVTLLSTGGTATALREAGLSVADVAEVTGFPEMMDGRLKTLHPVVHGGLLGRLPGDRDVMHAHGIEPIDLLVVNLYPFERTVAGGACDAEAIEQIDIGGPAMVRSAAKNHARVLVVVDPGDYTDVADAIVAGGGTHDRPLRRRLAGKAFAHTAAYDAAIAEYLTGTSPDRSGDVELLPTTIVLRYRKVADLRYGENPHQPAAVYVDEKGREFGVAAAKQLHGKHLSYINLLDADAAWAAAREFDQFGQAAACIVKHATPCGLATGRTAAEAFAGAFAADPLAAFGGIVAVNRTMDLAAAEAIVRIDKLLEVIVAPSFEEHALDVLRGRWKNCRLLAVGTGRPAGDGLMSHKIVGGLLVQRRDDAPAEPATWRTVSRRQPTDAERTDLLVAWLACKHVKSNAIVLARGGAAVGIGGGQVDRVGACQLAVAKAGERARGAVAASDAFFPFPDGPRALLEAGVTAIVHPGGSLRDDETTATVDAAGATLILTGRRHFRH